MRGPSCGTRRRDRRLIPEISQTIKSIRRVSSIRQSRCAYFRYALVHSRSTDMSLATVEEDNLNGRHLRHQSCKALHEPFGDDDDTPAKHEEGYCGYTVIHDFVKEQRKILTPPGWTNSLQRQVPARPRSGKRQNPCHAPSLTRELRTEHMEPVQSQPYMVLP